VKNIILCIGDPDQAYLERLNSYVQNRPGSPFAIRSFTKASPLKAASVNKGILLVTTALLMEAEQEYTDVQRAQVFVPERWSGAVYLDEGCGDYWPMFQDYFQDIPVQRLNKYQSARNIYNRLLELACSIGKYEDSETGDKKYAEVIGIYAPDFSSQQASVASWSLVQGLPVGSTLYISFEQFSGDRTGRSSELICWIKEMNPGIVLKMDSCVYHEKNADVLELAQYPYDLWEIGEQEWIYWLDLLQKKSRYDRIILNFANTLPGLSILEICSRVLLITATKHDGEESKAQKFGAMLEFMGRQNITGHLEMLPAGGASVE